MTEPFTIPAVVRKRAFEQVAVPSQTGRMLFVLVTLAEAVIAVVIAVTLR